MSKIYTAEDIAKILAITQMTVSLDALTEIDEPFVNMIKDDQSTPEEEIIAADRRDCIDKYMLKYLSKREREVILLRYGFDANPMTLNEIGERLNLSRERIRQIEARAIRKLRSAFMKCKVTRENI
jgi:RNA polymerase primary sigma factor